MGWARRRRQGYGERSAVLGGGGHKEAAAPWRAVDAIRPARREAVAFIRSAATFCRGRGWGGPGRGSSRAARSGGAGLAGRRGAEGLGRCEELLKAAGPRRAARRPSSCGAPPEEDAAVAAARPREVAEDGGAEGGGRGRDPGARPSIGSLSGSGSAWPRTSRTSSCPPELQEEAAAAAQPEHKQQKL